jgi:hypothetical protein
MPRLFEQDRLNVWYDGSAICVIAVGSHGVPLDLGENEVEALIEKLQRGVRESTIIKSCTKSVIGRQRRFVTLREIFLLGNMLC